MQINMLLVVISTKENNPTNSSRYLWNQKRLWENTNNKSMCLSIHSWLFLDEKASFVRWAVEQDW